MNTRLILGRALKSGKCKRILEIGVVGSDKQDVCGIMWDPSFTHVCSN